MMLPHSGVGGFIPTPKKLNPEEKRIAHGISKVEKTSPTETVLGRMCRKMILTSPAPHIDDDLARELYAIPGIVPSPVNFPAGCRFHPRCPCVIDDCLKKMPKLLPIGEGHTVRCSVVQKEKEIR
jgi:oligopeptide/dipeptide ABC transporter ATP-binding protein